MLERGFVYLLFGLYFVIGIVIGSFLNVCIYRLPLGKSVISPPSACGSCGHRLGALDMIPVLSYFGCAAGAATVMLLIAPVICW